MAECRNMECRNGYSPGIITSGKGTPNAPIVGAAMRWGWVNCRACKPKDKDPAYTHVSRSTAEIQERARLADSKAPYVHQAPPDRSRLQSLASNAPAPAPRPAAVSDERLDRLLTQNEKLTDQVSSLLEENRSLREKLESKTSKAVKKKRGGDDESSSTGRKSLS